MFENNYDVVIVGAGPAGAAAAYYSKKIDKDNKKILLVESLKGDKFNRYHHMCGEAVSKHIHNDFPDINIQKFVKNNIKYFFEYWGNNVQIKSKTKGYIIDRPNFLKNLINEFENNSGEILKDRVESCDKKSSKIIIKLKKRKISTKYLIIATGPNHPKNNIISLDGEVYKIPLYQITTEKFPLDKSELKFYYHEKYKENYKWIFPYGKNVKIGVPLKNRNEIAKYKKYNILRKDIKYVYSGILNNYSNDNTLIIGDAAFQNNPLTKGGIRTAFNAAKIAMESILKYKNPKHYDTIWKNSGFYNKCYISSCKLLKKMKNKDLEKHAKLFKYFPASFPIIVSKAQYRKYLPLYKTYIKSEKYGW